MKALQASGELRKFSTAEVDGVRGELEDRLAMPLLPGHIS